MTAKGNHRRQAQPGAGTPGGERRCIVSGVAYPRAEMIRFVKGPDGSVTPDLDQRLPGRGLWLHASRDALTRAASGRHFARALRGPVEVPADLLGLVEAGLAIRCQNLIGLARRAGSAVAGFEKTKAALKSGAACLLIAARDAAADGRGKLAALAPGLSPAAGLTAAELGAVFGRDHVVHVGVTDRGLGARIGAAMARLEAVREPAAGDGGIPGPSKVG